jgi:hypothetical protein
MFTYALEIFFLIAITVVCRLWVMKRSQTDQNTKLKQDSMPDHSSMWEDRKRAGEERDSR